MRTGTLLLPDTGPQFLSALNFAAIYSETVHSFTFTNPDSIVEFETLLDVLSRLHLSDEEFHRLESEVQEKFSSAVLETELVSELDDYERFVLFPEQNAAILTMAEREGVLISICENSMKYLIDDQVASRGFMQGLLQDLPAVLTPDLASSYRTGEFDTAMREASPSCFSLIQEILEILLPYGPSLGILPERTSPEQIETEPGFLRSVAFGSYLISACFYSISNNLTPFTWQPNLHRLVTDILLAMRKGNASLNALLAAQEDTPSRLGELVLRELAPNVAALPFEEILQLRSKRHAELEAFRTGLAEIAAGIDPNLDADTLEAVLHGKIDKVFRPALRDLNRVTNDIRKDAYRKLFRPDKNVMLELIPMAITVSSGAPLAYSAATAGLPLLDKLYDFTIGKTSELSKVNSACPWSILIDLRKT